MSTTFLKEFDVEVNQYLTYAQIVQISQLCPNLLIGLNANKILIF